MVALWGDDPPLGDPLRAEEVASAFALIVSTFSGKTTLYVTENPSIIVRSNMSNMSKIKQYEFQIELFSLQVLTDRVS